LERKKKKKRKRRRKEPLGCLGGDTLRLVKATSVKGISDVVKTVKGFQPEGNWNKGTGNQLRDCTGALLLTVLPNQADSCSVELTEGWCRAAY
jgi:hypothetical protein